MFTLFQNEESLRVLILQRVNYLFDRSQSSEIVFFQAPQKLKGSFTTKSYNKALFKKINFNGKCISTRYMAGANASPTQWCKNVLCSHESSVFTKDRMHLATGYILSLQCTGWCSELGASFVYYLSYGLITPLGTSGYTSRGSIYMSRFLHRIKINL